MPVQLFWIGKYKLNWEVEDHEHDHYQIMVCMSGKGFVYLEDWPIAFKPGRVFFLPPRTSHRTVESKEGIQILDIKFHVTSPEFTRELEHLPKVTTIAGNPLFMTLLKGILEESSRKKSFHITGSNAYLTLFLIKLLRKEYLYQPRADDSADILELEIWESESGVINDHKYIHFDPVIQYIHSNLDKQISLDELARQLNINRSYFTTLFVQHFGTTPIKYINQLRIDAAKKLLMESDFSITQISEKTGFQSVQYFCRYFKSALGQTPTQYRAQNRDNIFINV